MSDTSVVPAKRPTVTAGGTGAILLTASGLLAGLATASCCALPMLLGTLGFGSTWLFHVGVIAAPHRTGILAVGTTAIGSAALLLWRQRSVVCAQGTWCAQPWARAMIAAGLAIGVMLLIAGYRYA